jgi:hypothetical protein
LVRVLAVANLVHFVAMSYPPYFRSVAGGAFGDAVGTWFVVSTLLLPIFVGLECWWMRKDSESRALALDWILVIAWIAVFWGAAVYGLGHYAIP